MQILSSSTALSVARCGHGMRSESTTGRGYSPASSPARSSWWGRPSHASTIASVKTALKSARAGAMRMCSLSPSPQTRYAVFTHQAVADTLMLRRHPAVHVHPAPSVRTTFAQRQTFGALVAYTIGVRDRAAGSQLTVTPSADGPRGAARGWLRAAVPLQPRPCCLLWRDRRKPRAARRRLHHRLLPHPLPGRRLDGPRHVAVQRRGVADSASARLTACRRRRSSSCSPKLKGSLLESGVPSHFEALKLSQWMDAPVRRNAWVAPCLCGTA